MSGQRFTYWPLVALIYFFNAFLLPHGLLYSALLTPVFMYWLWKRNIRGFYLWFALLSVVFALVHFSNGVSTRDYLVSLTLVFTTLVFLMACFRWIKESDDLQALLKKLLLWNSLFVLLALLALPFGLGREILWYEVPISKGIEQLPRLKLFTYEASYYGLLFTPVFLYFFWKILLGLEKHWLLVALAIFLPMILSFSLGVWAGSLLAIGLTGVIYVRPLWQTRSVRKALLYSSAFGVACIALLALFYPGNPLFIRLHNIFSGVDTSAKGRLIESFMFAFDLARSKSLLFGIGPGQIKVFGHDLIVNYYRYEGEFAEIVRIPNSMGEWLATYGLIGFAGKLVLEVILFIRHRVYLNLFNLSLFSFIFIYQFTGSFLINTAEIMVWGLAIYSSFKEFQFQPVQWQRI